MIKNKLRISAFIMALFLSIGTVCAQQVKEDEIVKFDSYGVLSEFKKTAADGTIYHGKFITKDKNRGNVKWELTITNKTGDWYHGYVEWFNPEEFYHDVENGEKTWDDAILMFIGPRAYTFFDYRDDNYKTDKDAYRKFYMCQGNDVNDIFKRYVDDGSEFEYIKAADLKSNQLIIINESGKPFGLYNWHLNKTYLNTYETDFVFHAIEGSAFPIRMLHKTLKDGQILVRLKKGYINADYVPWAEIIYPDGRKYVGNISYNNLTYDDYFNMAELDINFWDTITTVNDIEFYRGDLTYPDGKTETYNKEEDLKTVVERTGDITVYNWSSNTVNAYKTAQEQARAQGLKERAEQEAKEAKEREEEAKKLRKDLNARYGTKYVDALYRGEIVVGMHEDLFAIGVAYDLFNNITNAKLDHESAGRKCFKLYGYRAYEGSTRITISSSSLIGWVWIKDGKISSIDWL